MWRIWHKLFGWDYVIIEMMSRGIVRRIRYDGDGRSYVLIAGAPVHLAANECEGGYAITALTCTSADMKRDRNNG